MKYLITLLLALFIASCSSPTQTEDKEPEFEPYVLGSWNVLSETQSEYIGSESKSKVADGDTVIIDQPGKRQLTLVKDKYDDSNALFIEFTMSFVDSTVTRNSGVDISNSSFVNYYDTDAFESMGSSQTLSPDLYKASVRLRYFCKRIVPKNLNIKLKVNTETGLYRMYVIKQKGFIDVLNNQFCVK